MAEKRKYQEAIENLKRALKTFPDDPRFHFALAGAYYLDRDYANAWHHARRAQALGSPDAEALLENLGEVSEEPGET